MNTTLKLPPQLLVRTLSGAVYLLLILLSLLLKNGILFSILFSLIGFVAVLEYNRMSQVSRQYPFRVLLDACAVVWLFLMGCFSLNPLFGSFAIIPLLVYIFYVLIRSLFLDANQELKSIANSLFPLVYIGFPLYLAGKATLPFPLEMIFSGDSFVGIGVLSVFIIVWANDTFAYLVGCMFGKTPLISRLSPHKTIEGFAGGLIASLLLGGAMVWIFPSYFGFAPFWVKLIYGLVVGIFADLGDLFESMLKRRMGVKDSGKLIPGHGGILDRIDSFLFAIGGAYIFFMIYFSL